jgi:hypothetical protein
MSTRTATGLAWSLCLLSLALTALSLLFLALSRSHPNAPIFEYWVENTMVAVTSSLVGAVLASRRPSHPIGWLFCVIGILGAVRHLGAEYAIYALVAQRPWLMCAEMSAWVSSWMWVPHVGLMVFLLLLFPDGQLPNARWRLLASVAVVAVLGGTVAMAFSPGPLSGLGPIENPFGLEEMGRLVSQVEALVWALILVVAASLLARWRAARGVRRQQIKWFAYAIAVAAIGGALTYIGGSEAMGVWQVRWAGLALIVVGSMGAPIAMGIAIMRYRLYGIDIVINRTLVYGSLTAILAGVYFGGVTATQALFRTLTGQEKLPQIVVVASTLVIAALFTPLRRRIQSFIDRRFYRKKYDAAKTLEGFSTRLRDETDLEALRGDLEGVVKETMQPAHVSLWLRPETAPQRRQPN